MPDRDSEEMEQLLAEGWIATDPKYFRFIVSHPPPRPNSYSYQFKIDVRGWPVISLWVIGLACLVLGAVFAQSLVLFLGAWLLGTWVILFRSAARSLRDGRVGTGEILSMRPHSLIRTASVADAQLPKGGSVPVVVPTSSASGILKDHGRVEVMFVVGPKGGGGQVVAVRRPPSGQPDPVDPTGS